jgi:hypothetical protein
MTAGDKREKLAKIAGDVLSRAALLDPRINVELPVIEAWADLFEGQKVWMDEALKAVNLHYSKPNPFPIMPGDIIAFCANCAPGSSADHANDFLDYWCDYPYAEAIEEVSGIAPPTFTVPDGLTLNERRQHLVKQLTAWVDENRARLVEAILERAWKSEDE